jgi:hypothetical protein
MRKLLLALLLLLVLPLTAGAGLSFPVPSGGTSGNLVYLSDGNTLGDFSSVKTDGVAYIGPEQFTGYAGTWTMTREAAGQQSLVLTAGTVDAFAVVDITEFMRSTASKGMKLSSIQYAFGLGVKNLTTHTINVTKTTFTDNAAPTTADVLAATALYNTFGTVTSPYIRTATIAVPAYLNPFPDALTNVKWTIEVRTNNADNTTYRIYGMWLVFTYDHL